MPNNYQATDLYAAMGGDLLSPAQRLRAITPADNTALPVATKAIYVGGAGNLTVIAVDDTSPVTFVAVPVGTVLLVRAGCVMATGTTATNLVGLC
jgi:hypothetical protein